MPAPNPSPWEHLRASQFAIEQANSPMTEEQQRHQPTVNNPDCPISALESEATSQGADELDLSLPYEHTDSLQDHNNSNPRLVSTPTAGLRIQDKLRSRPRPSGHRLELTDARKCCSSAHIS